MDQPLPPIQTVPYTRLEPPTAGERLQSIHTSTSCYVCTQGGFCRLAVRSLETLFSLIPPDTVNQSRHRVVSRRLVGAFAYILDRNYLVGIDNQRDFARAVVALVNECESRLTEWENNRQDASVPIDPIRFRLSMALSMLPLDSDKLPAEQVPQSWTRIDHLCSMLWYSLGRGDPQSQPIAVLNTTSGAVSSSGSWSLFHHPVFGLEVRQGKLIRKEVCALAVASKLAVGELLKISFKAISKLPTEVTDRIYFWTYRLLQSANATVNGALAHQKFWEYILSHFHHETLARRPLQTHLDDSCLAHQIFRYGTPSGFHLYQTTVMPSMYIYSWNDHVFISSRNNDARWKQYLESHESRQISCGVTGRTITAGAGVIRCGFGMLPYNLEHCHFIQKGKALIV
ncbi:hypothetical protein HDV05_005617 [Chytridiales sp. JEL 0842]|nr:hypothetical protein HDV05_005617 [Chytridiales sp. JEL 0842]